jgi:hypothetical protein
MVRTVDEALALREAGTGLICTGEIGGRAPLPANRTKSVMSLLLIVAAKSRQRTPEKAWTYSFCRSAR